MLFGKDVALPPLLLPLAKSSTNKQKVPKFAGGIGGTQGRQSTHKASLRSGDSTDPFRATHRLHQDVVFAIQEGGPGVLVQRLYVIPGRQGGPVIHAATGVPFLDLETKAREIAILLFQIIGLVNLGAQV